MAGHLPEVKNVKPNKYYAYLLQQDYAGVVSEMTAISQYVYNHIILEPKYGEVAELFEKISMAEMEHMEALGEAILAFGGDPRIGVPSKKQAYRYWKGSYVAYNKRICTILNEAIKGEKKAITNYMKHRRMIKEPQTRALLTAIIADEKKHISLLNKAKLACKCK